MIPSIFMIILVSKVSLKNIEFDMYYVKAIASFPENLSFDKMHICGSIAWFFIYRKRYVAFI